MWQTDMRCGNVNKDIKSINKPNLKYYGFVYQHFIYYIEYIKYIYINFK